MPLKPTLPEKEILRIREIMRRRFGDAIFDHRTKTREVLDARQDAVQALRDGYLQVSRDRSSLVSVVPNDSEGDSATRREPLSWPNIAAILDYRSHTSPMTVYRERTEPKP